MLTPILVTRINEHTVEVLTDFRTTIQSAEVSKGNPVTVLREPKDSPGLIGTIWTLESQDGSLSDTLILTARRAGDVHEYTVKL